MFIKFVRPDGKEVMVATAWIQSVRPIDPNREQGNAVVVLSGHEYQVKEVVEDIYDRIVRRGEGR